MVELPVSGAEHCGGVWGLRVGGLFLCLRWLEWWCHVEAVVEGEGVQRLGDPGAPHLGYLQLPEEASAVHLLP